MRFQFEIIIGSGRKPAPIMGPQSRAETWLERVRKYAFKFEAHCLGDVRRGKVDLEVGPVRRDVVVEAVVVLAALAELLRGAFHLAFADVGDDWFGDYAILIGTDDDLDNAVSLAGSAESEWGDSVRERVQLLDQRMCERREMPRRLGDLDRDHAPAPWTIRKITSP